MNAIIAKYKKSLHVAITPALAISTKSIISPAFILYHFGLRKNF